MNTRTEPSIAQLAESFLQRTALGVLLMAVVYTLAAAMYLVEEPLRRQFDVAQTALALLAMVIVLPGLLRMLRARLRGDCDSVEADSYMGNVFRKACVMAFSVTFVALTAAGPISNKLSLSLPADFYLQLILAVSLGVFSASFFTALWRDRDPTDVDEDVDIGFGD